MSVNETVGRLEAASRLRVHPSSVDRWIATGKLEAYKLGLNNRVAVSVASLERLIAERTALVPMGGSR